MTQSTENVDFIAGPPPGSPEYRVLMIADTIERKLADVLACPTLVVAQEPRLRDAFGGAPPTVPDEETTVEGGDVEAVAKARQDAEIRTLVARICEKDMSPVRIPTVAESMTRPYFLPIRAEPSDALKEKFGKKVQELMDAYEDYQRRMRKAFKKHVPPELIDPESGDVPAEALTDAFRQTTDRLRRQYMMSLGDAYGAIGGTVFHKEFAQAVCEELLDKSAWHYLESNGYGPYLDEVFSLDVLLAAAGFIWVGQLDGKGQPEHPMRVFEFAVEPRVADTDDAGDGESDDSQRGVAVYAEHPDGYGRTFATQVPISQLKEPKEGDDGAATSDTETEAEEPEATVPHGVTGMSLATLVTARIAYAVKLLIGEAMGQAPGKYARMQDTTIEITGTILHEKTGEKIDKAIITWPKSSLGDYLVEYCFFTVKDETRSELMLRLLMRWVTVGDHLMHRHRSGARATNHYHCPHEAHKGSKDIDELLDMPPPKSDASE